MEASLEGEGRRHVLATNWKGRYMRKIYAKVKAASSCSEENAIHIVTLWSEGKQCVLILKSLNHFNDVYCFLGHTVRVCKTWLSWLRSLTLSFLRNNPATCLLALTQGALPSCLLALPTALLRDHSAGSWLGTAFQAHLQETAVSREPARKDFAMEKKARLSITSYSTRVFLLTSSISQQSSFT